MTLVPFNFPLHHPGEGMRLAEVAKRKGHEEGYKGLVIC